MSIDELQKYRYERIGRFKVSKSYCAEHDIKPLQYSRHVCKILHHDEIGSWYDVCLSVTSNLQYAQSQNIKISRATLYKFCKENNINPNPMKVPIESWYEVMHSVDENYQYALSHKIKVSKRTLYNYCKKNNLNTNGLN